MPTRWTFGEEPLAQTVELAAALRRVTELALALEHEDPAVARLLDDLAAAEAALAARAPTDGKPRIGDATEGRPYLDHARHVGAFDPAFPEYTIEVDGDRATGTVTFSRVYEGPPGLVHGGFLAVLVDAAVQHHSCDVGVAGKTTALTIRYRRPTPLDTPLSFTIDRVVADGRIRSILRLHHDDVLVCEGEVEAIAGDLAKLPPVSRRKPAP